ncbi:MAG: M28 family peptidase [Verrucomicrobiota bacterium]
MKQRRVIPMLLMILPAGTVVLGAGSLIWYFVSGNAPDGKPEVTSLMQKQIEQVDLERYVGLLTEDIGERNTANPKQLGIAANFLEGTLGPQNMGYTVRRQVFEVDGVECANLEVEIPGRGLRDEVVVVGAHYDSVPGTVGANDNATGVAALLALANRFVGTGNERTLRFVAFVNEEPPYFQTEDMGSRRYVRRAKERGEEVVGMVCLETIGYFSDEPGSQRYPEGLEGVYPDAGNFIAMVSNLESRDLLETSVEAFRGVTELPVEFGVFPPDVPGVSLSDHWSFWEAGYPAIMVTDTAPFRYPFYHTAEDTSDKIDYERFYEVVLGVEGVVERLVNPGR